MNSAVSSLSKTKTQKQEVGGKIKKEKHNIMLLILKTFVGINTKNNFTTTENRKVSYVCMHTQMHTQHTYTSMYISRN